MSEKDVNASRRGFLKLAATGMPATVAAVASASVSAKMVDKPISAGLRKTEHVEKYFETARF